MRINIDIDDNLLRKAMEISQLTTKKAIIELALKEYIRMMQRKDLLATHGPIQWDGDLNQMRTDETLNEWDL